MLLSDHIGVMIQQGEVRSGEQPDMDGLRPMNVCNSLVVGRVDPYGEDMRDPYCVDSEMAKVTGVRNIYTVGPQAYVDLGTNIGRVYYFGEGKVIQEKMNPEAPFSGSRYRITGEAGMTVRVRVPHPLYPNSGPPTWQTTRIYNLPT